MLHIPSCFDALDEIEGNSNECHDVSYDSYLDIENIDSSSSQLNPLDQSQITCENDEHCNSKIVSNSSHFQRINHTHDFNI